MSISPSAEPIVEESPKARLMPLTGRPMLLRIVATSCSGIVARTAASTLLNSFSVSSRRVPVGALTCIRIWPASTAGKKSSPNSPNRSDVPPTKNANATQTNPRWPNAQVSMAV